MTYIWTLWARQILLQHYEHFSWLDFSSRFCEDAFGRLTLFAVLCIAKTQTRVIVCE